MQEVEKWLIKIGFKEEVPLFSGKDISTDRFRVAYRIAVIFIRAYKYALCTWQCITYCFSTVQMYIFTHTHHVLYCRRTKSVEKCCVSLIGRLKEIGVKSIGKQLELVTNIKSLFGMKVLLIKFIFVDLI